MEKNLSSYDKKTLLFPHEVIRSFQNEMIDLISRALEEQKHVVVHAPTGLGKTAASIAPALTKALADGKTVFFLTSKNTQHRIAIDTLKKIKEKHNLADLRAVDVVGKKWMCLQPGVSVLSSGEFAEYCKALREDRKCAYYENLRRGEQLTADARLALSAMKIKSPIHVEEIVDIGADNEVCPYELAMLLAKESQVIVTDYYYLFHPRIRDNFLKKNEKTLEDSIIIVDEAHNLPERIKNLASSKLSTTMLRRAASEAKKFKHDDLISIFERLDALLKQVVPTDKDEEIFPRERFINAVNNHTNYELFKLKCFKAAESIREEQKSSAIGGVGEFLEAWEKEQEGFVRIIAKKRGRSEQAIELSYRCLDPSLVSKKVIQDSFATILMSGTLTPTKMFADLLGFPPMDTLQEELPSPFPQENRLNLIVAKTSTKFTTRSEDQYREIAKILTDVINATPGNSAIFFPSYYLKDRIAPYMESVRKTVFQEQQAMSKLEKDEMLEKFKSYVLTGATLLAVGAGSYGEGIDLPGDLLKTVVVVGLPLARPDLETDALIKYYDKKYRRGWDYGYVFPAFNKVIQNAGRVIRSENDRGVIVFLDDRYTEDRYYRCFPPTWKMKVSVNRYKELIDDFFEKKKE